MRRLIDHVLCGLPFEAEWFRRQRCNAVLVGHPFFDEIGAAHYDEAFLAQHRRESGPLVTILPGSRTQEVDGNLEMLLAAARRIRTAVPTVRFAIAAFKSQHAAMAMSAVSASELGVEIHVGKTQELMQLSDCCMAVSGSVSLELLCRKKPTVILYRIGRVAYLVQAVFRRVKYITLVNLLAAEDPFSDNAADSRPEEALFPEFLTCRDQSEAIAAQVIAWLNDPVALGQRVDRLGRLKAAIAEAGAAGRAADYILQALASEPAKIPQPHFRVRQAFQPDRKAVSSSSV